MLMMLAVLMMCRCDADPQVLSKYVLALLQNNPQKEGLREVCISKLEEFLGDGMCCWFARST